MTVGRARKPANTSDLREWLEGWLALQTKWDQLAPEVGCSDDAAEVDDQVK